MSHQGRSGMDVGKKVYEIDSSEFMLWPGQFIRGLRLGYGLEWFKIWGSIPLENCKTISGNKYGHDYSDTSNRS